jgi:hypothetical protein
LRGYLGVIASLVGATIVKARPFVEIGVPLAHQCDHSGIDRSVSAGLASRGRRAALRNQFTEFGLIRVLPAALYGPKSEAARRPHDHHRDVRTRHNPALPSERANSSNQDRHVMIVPAPPSPRIALFCRCRSSGHASARVNSTLVPQIMSQSSLLAPHTDDRTKLVGCITFNNQLKPPVAFPSARPAHGSNPHN